MKVFLSYSRRDAQFVDRIDQALTKGGYDVWFDRRDVATSGEDRWRNSIAKAIRDSDTVVLVLSPNSTTSETVERELTIAAESRRRIVPVVYRECELPDRFAYELAGIQDVDFANTEFAEAARQLMRQLGPPSTQVRRFDEPLAPPAAVASPPPPPEDPKVVTIDAPHPRGVDRRWRAIAIAGGTTAIVGIVAALLTLGGGDPDDAATATTASPTSATSTTAARSVATTAAPTTTVPADQRAVAIVDEWAAATSKRDWASAARIDNSGTIKDYDQWYGRLDEPSHMERVDLYVDRTAPYGTSWLVKGAVITRDDSASRGPSTNVVCSYWVVDLQGQTAAWNKVEAHRVRPPIDPLSYENAYARYCS